MKNPAGRGCGGVSSLRGIAARTSGVSAANSFCAVPTRAASAASAPPANTVLCVGLVPIRTRRTLRRSLHGGGGPASFWARKPLTFLAIRTLHPFHARPRVLFGTEGAHRIFFEFLVSSRL